MMSKNNQLILIVVLIVGIVAIYWMKTTTPQVSPENNWNNWENQQKPGNNWNQPKPQAPAPQMPPAQPNMQQPGNPPQNPLNAPSYQDALNLSKTHKKPVLLFFTANWCGYCQQMKNQTFNDADVKAALSSVIYCEIDVDKDRTTARKFGVSPIPTYKLIDNSEKVLAEGSGFKPPQAFITWLKSGTSRSLFENWGFNWN